MKDSQQLRKDRLDALAKRAGGNATLGRKLGYKDGALIWQMLNGVRPISEKFIAKVHAVHEWRDWFNEADGSPATEVSTPAPPLTSSLSKIEQALQAIDDALEPLDAEDRRSAVRMLRDLETPGRASSVARMFSGAVQALSSKLRAA